MMEKVGTGLGWLLLAALAVLLAVRVAQSLQNALRRPGSTTEAVLAFSLTTGRFLLLLAVGAVWLSNRIRNKTGSSGTGVAAVGVLAVLVLMAAETRWPRQAGAIRVAQLTRPTLRTTVRARYLVGASVVLALTALGAWFFLLVDPTAISSSTSGWWSSYSSGTFQTLVPPDVTTCDGCYIGYATVTTAPLSTGGVWLDCTLLLIATLLGVLTVRQILRRRSLAGVGADVDVALRRISAGRVVRCVTATALATVGGWAGDFHEASYVPLVTTPPLTESIATFSSGVAALCYLGVLLLYIVGPNKSRLRKLVPPVVERT